MAVQSDAAQWFPLALFTLGLPPFDGLVLLDEQEILLRTSFEIAHIPAHMQVGAPEVLTQPASTVDVDPLEPL